MIARHIPATTTWWGRLGIWPIPTISIIFPTTIIMIIIMIIVIIMIIIIIIILSMMMILSGCGQSGLDNCSSSASSSRFTNFYTSELSTISISFKNQPETAITSLCPLTVSNGHCPFNKEHLSTFCAISYFWYYNGRKCSTSPSRIWIVASFFTIAILLWI